MSEFPKAFWSNEHQCWFVPVSSALMDQERVSVEPVRLEFHNGQMLITKLQDDKP